MTRTSGVTGMARYGPKMTLQTLRSPSKLQWQEAKSNNFAIATWQNYDLIHYILTTIIKLLKLVDKFLEMTPPFMRFYGM